MKTLDGAALIKKRLEKLHSQYPEGSLSPREIIMTIPMDYDEAKIQQVNSEITRAIYQQAEEFVKNNPPTIKKPGFSVIPKDLSYNDKRAEEEAAKQKLTQTVVDAVHSITAKK